MKVAEQKGKRVLVHNTMLTMKIKSSLLNELKASASANELNVAQAVRVAIQGYINDNGGQLLDVKRNDSNEHND